MLPRALARTIYVTFALMLANYGQTLNAKDRSRTLSLVLAGKDAIF
jgi:hypothetical protein